MGVNSISIMFNNNSVWRDRVRRLANDPVVMRSRPATGHNVVHCLLINPIKLNLLSWLLVYLSDK